MKTFRKTMVLAIVALLALVVSCQADPSSQTTSQQETTNQQDNPEETEQTKKYKLTLTYGDKSSTVEIFSGEAITLPEPNEVEMKTAKAAGLDFGGWFDSNFNKWESNDKMPSHDLSLTKLWVVPADEKLAFTKTSDTTCEVSGIGTWEGEILLIPKTSHADDETNGLSVTGIGEDSFRYTTVKNIIIQDSVTSIGEDAFWGCSGLTSITIGDSVTSIGEDAFSNCTGLTSITIPNSVTSIGECAFSSCTGLTSITIGDSVTSIGEDAFYDCTGLTNINVDADNPNYCSENGVLYNKAKTTLIRYPGGKTGSFTIPNSVTSIGNSAFDGCTGLTSVTIPDSVTSIGDYAFPGCTGLTSITIPNSVTSIGECAFSECTGLKSITIGNSVKSIGYFCCEDCTDLTSITFSGTKAKWALIAKEYDWNVRVPATTVHCSDGDVSI